MKEHYVVEDRFRHIQIADKWFPSQSFWHFNSIRQGRPIVPTSVQQKPSHK